MNKKKNSFLAQQEIAPCRPSTDFSVDGGGYAACGANATEAKAAEQNNDIPNMEFQKQNGDAKTNAAEQNDRIRNTNAETNDVKQEYGIQNANAAEQNDGIPNAEFKKTSNLIQNSEFRIQNNDVLNEKTAKTDDENSNAEQTKENVQNSKSEKINENQTKSNENIQNSEFQKPRKISKKPKFSAVTTRRLAYTAVFVALSVVANGGAVTAQGNTISFTYIVAFLAGTVLGPIGGFLVGFLGDLLGFLIIPQGPTYMPLIGISSGLMGLIPGVVMNLKILDRADLRLSPVKSRLLKTGAIVLSMGLIALICTTCLNTLGTFILYSSKVHTFTNWLVYLAARAPLQFPVVALNTAIIIFAFHAVEKDLKNTREKLKSKK
jgi:ECF transporter S component (folate family)